MNMSTNGIGNTYAAQAAAQSAAAAQTKDSGKVNKTGLTLPIHLRRRRPSYILPL